MFDFFDENFYIITYVYDVMKRPPRLAQWVKASSQLYGVFCRLEFLPTGEESQSQMHAISNPLSPRNGD